MKGNYRACQDCWQRSNPDQYAPELTQYDTCVACGAEALTIRILKADVWRYKSDWKYTFPLTPELPERLQGPEVGEVLAYEYPVGTPKGTAKVLERSYVWSPEVLNYGQHGTPEQGQPLHRGYRHYEWSVVEVTEPGRRPYTVVVNDTNLFPLTPPVCDVHAAR